MTCDHPSALELVPGVAKCSACGMVNAGNGWAPIALPPKPCCPDCAKSMKQVMDEYARKQGCSGCGKNR